MIDLTKARRARATPIVAPGAMPRLTTGLDLLDRVLGGGLPRGTVTLLAGRPGTGKTILAQQICFAHASEETPVLFVTTLSEPMPKTMLFLSQLGYFDRGKLERGLHFVDVGSTLREGLESTVDAIVEQVKRIGPALVVIDSVKVCDDAAGSNDRVRAFGFELAVKLMAWDTTALLLGEYGPDDLERNPLFSIADGVISVGVEDRAGESIRTLRVLKMRGTDHLRDRVVFRIGSAGVELFAPSLTISRDPAREIEAARSPALKTRIPGLDDVLPDGIPRGSTVFVRGPSGSGKTLLLLELLHGGAKAFGERGLYVSLGESRERLLAEAAALSLPLDAVLQNGMLEILELPPTRLELEERLELLRERIARGRFSRVAIDPVSAMLDRIADPDLAADTLHHIARIVQDAGAVGFLALDPAGPNGDAQDRLVGGVIRLAAGPMRTLEVRKLRGAPFRPGAHPMTISLSGVRVHPRRPVGERANERPGVLPTGVGGLDGALGGGAPVSGAILVLGPTGAGKSLLAAQFLSATKESGVLVASNARSAPPALARAIDVRRVRRLDPEVSELPLESLLADAVVATRARRVVVDVASAALDGAAIARLQGHGATVLVTAVDAASAPRHDYDIVLALDREPRRLTILKSPGGRHDSGARGVSIGAAGISVTDAMRARGRR